MTALTEIGSAFLFGVLTPLSAVCVLPLYPGFITFLSRQQVDDASRRTYLMVGGTVVAGVITFMLLTGIVFTTVLQYSLTSVVGTVSPIAFTILGIIGLFLVLDTNIAQVIPRKQLPRTGRPLVDGFGFGFFFGAIVLPCNPAFIAAFFARSLLIQSPVINLLAFIAFGVGMGAPLLLFAVAASAWRDRVMQGLTRHETAVNRASGLILLAISFYYLVVVFQLLGSGPAEMVGSILRSVKIVLPTAPGA
jgi:cytochrome c-type biogenesis protein